MRYIIANWKANKNYNEASSWLDFFITKINASQPVLEAIRSKKIKIILCPPSPLLFILRSKSEALHLFKSGAQDVSAFDEGSFTGEIPAHSLEGLAEYVIIGHSERRALFQEKTDLLAKKVRQALKYGLKPVYCVKNEDDPVPDGVAVLAYEPPSAIGTGENASVKEATKMRAKLNLRLPYVYGGSVDYKNIKSYLEAEEIDGFLIGKASLSPHSFFEVILQSVI